MRIISQSGNTDLNYDNCVIIVDDNVIEAHVNDDVYNLGIYSSETKAKKVMNELIKVYTKVERTGGNSLNDGGESYFPYYKYSIPKFFQFPKDEEVSV